VVSFQKHTHKAVPSELDFAAEPDGLFLEGDRPDPIAGLYGISNFLRGCKTDCVNAVLKKAEDDRRTEWQSEKN
jgi:hypothetical protein